MIWILLLSILALVFAVPIVSRFERQRPFAVASLAVGVGLCARFDVIASPATDQYRVVVEGPGDGDASSVR